MRLKAIPVRNIIYFAAYAGYETPACSGLSSTSKCFLAVCCLNIWSNSRITLLGQALCHLTPGALIPVCLLRKMMHFTRPGAVAGDLCSNEERQVGEQGSPSCSEATGSVCVKQSMHIDWSHWNLRLDGKNWQFCHWSCNMFLVLLNSVTAVNSTRSAW